MFALVTEENLEAAARVHALSWRESHKGFCSAEFVAAHTTARQMVYIRGEMERVLESSRQRVQLARLVKIIYYAVNTLAGLGLFVTFLLQLRIWHTGG